MEPDVVKSEQSKSEEDWLWSGRGRGGRSWDELPGEGGGEAPPTAGLILKRVGWPAIMAPPKAVLPHPNAGPRNGHREERQGDCFKRPDCAHRQYRPDRYLSFGCGLDERGAGGRARPRPPPPETDLSITQESPPPGSSPRRSRRRSGKVIETPL
ncbi:hypothetical protein SKAU_G00365640 [Synaphobranchus kaupii]|uniref:Uncharacterized protein n=1 Tax=Synaphobranchus kaupii TaxID=118154 RepID=A0A9Q1EF11_SYNKA|nr:hypothetical protein SKAU_G00365640 [Synaphobranchus kaupii]